MNLKTAKFKKGDQVKVIDSNDMPMPQHLYSGKHGTVLSVGVDYVYVSPNEPLSGGDEYFGVPFFPKELTVVEASND